MCEVALPSTTVVPYAAIESCADGGSKREDLEMTEQDKYDEVYALFTALAEYAAELSDTQHICVMEAFNAFVEAPHPMPASAPAVTADGAAHVLTRTARSLGGLIDVTEHGEASLQFARAHALLMASLAA